MSDSFDASSPVPWPPIIFATAFGFAIAAKWQWPLFIADSSYGPLFWFSILLILTGCGIALAAERRFLKAGTATLPTRPTIVVVADGIFRFTRNPMYLGMSMVLAGAAFFTNSWWFLLVLPFAMAAVTKLAIEREEIYLEKKFGPVYRAYKAQTRRWL
jgi:protein-S-isoprenylcysteine O-methyltransferase Ste14